jgi:hypothetical protein
VRGEPPQIRALNGGGAVKGLVGAAALPKSGMRFAIRGKGFLPPIADWDLAMAIQHSSCPMRLKVQQGAPSARNRAARVSGRRNGA